MYWVSFVARQPDVIGSINEGSPWVWQLGFKVLGVGVLELGLVVAVNRDNGLNIRVRGLESRVQTLGMKGFRLDLVLKWSWLRVYSLWSIFFWLTGQGLRYKLGRRALGFG